MIQSGDTVRCDHVGVTGGWYSQVLRSGDTAWSEGQVVQSGVTVR